MWGAVNWINDQPILDGMPIFGKKSECIDYITASEAVEAEYNHTIDTRWTIIRLIKNDAINKDIAGAYLTPAG